MMTKPSQKKMTDAAPLAAKATPKKGQSTLKNARDKKVGNNAPTAPAILDTPLDTPSAPMTENTQSANNDTDTKMHTPPPPHSPPLPDKRSKEISKRFKTVADDDPMDTTSEAKPHPPDMNKSTIPVQPTPVPMMTSPAQPVTPVMDKSEIPANVPLPASPPALQPRGRSPPSLPNLPANNNMPSA